MKIEVLYVPDCPNHAVALERLREVLSAESFQTDVSHVLIGDEQMARSLRFPGSPTIRVNGQDVEPHDEKNGTYGLMCRLYPHRSGAPTVDALRAAIETARGFEV